MVSDWKELYQQQLHMQAHSPNVEDLEHHLMPFFRRMTRPAHFARGQTTSAPVKWHLNSSRCVLPRTENTMLQHLSPIRKPCASSKSHDHINISDDINIPQLVIPIISLYPVITRFERIWLACFCQHCLQIALNVFSETFFKKCYSAPLAWAWTVTIYGVFKVISCFDHYTALLPV